ncbi:MAG: hypothetical protein ACR2Q4_23150 [Geminicoccaceae bacterium]
MSSDDERRTKSVALRPVVDWRLAATLLAQGMSVAEAARQAGCTRRQLSRRRNHDQLFQAWIMESESDPSAPSDGRLDSLRQRLHEAIDAEVQGGNVRVILWLADRLKLVNPPDKEKPASPLNDLLRAMTNADIKEFENLKG